MNAVRAVLAPLCDPAQAATLRWQVLRARRHQPLLVPADAPRFAAAAIRFFVGSRTRRWLAHAQHAWLRRAACADLALTGFPAATLFAQQGYAPPASLSLALCCGSPGPLRKLVVLGAPHGTDPDGAAGQDALRVAKIALAASADGSIDREAHWLRVLGRAPATARFVPRLLNEGRLFNGRRFVVMSALPRGVASHAFGTCHGDFLAALGRHGRTLAPWSVSPGCARLHQRWEAIEGLLDTAPRRLLRDTLGAIERALGRTVLPTCLAHGDFAPWNMRLCAGQLFVFDWEYAEAGANPLHDYLHFHLMTRIAAGRPVRAAWLRQLLAGATRHGYAVFGGAASLGRAVPLLLVQYLFDTISFYVQQSGYLDPDHPVLRRHLHLLATRAAWCVGDAV